MRAILIIDKTGKRYGCEFMPIFETPEKEEEYIKTRIKNTTDIDIIFACIVDFSKNKIIGLE